MRMLKKWGKKCITRDKLGSDVHCKYLSIFFEGGIFPSCEKQRCVYKGRRKNKKR